MSGTVSDALHTFFPNRHNHSLTGSSANSIMLMKELKTKRGAGFNSSDQIGLGIKTGLIAWIGFLRS